MRSCMCFVKIIKNNLKPFTGEVPNAFRTRNYYTWTEAKNNHDNCTMIGQENYVNISSGIEEELWIDATVIYSPWIEYLGKYVCECTIQIQITQYS